MLWLDWLRFRLRALRRSRLERDFDSELHGIRIALGAPRREVLLLVIRRGCALLALGLAIGVTASLVATRAPEQLLHQISGTDWISFSVAVGVLAVVALGATTLPAIRALRVDPMSVLRD